MPTTSNSLPGKPTARTGTRAVRERAERIKAEIRIRAGSMAAFARRHDYDRTAISIALKKPWPEVERIIADLLGVAPAELWPERYAKRGASRV